MPLIINGEKMAKPHWDQYGNYLQVDKILSAQKPLSDVAGHPAHDEMLFIQFHQIYELWFKQILFELDDVITRLSGDHVDEKNMQPIVTHLGRVVEIFKQMESMIDVLETMPPQSFVDFREYLGTASGFQSLQFRLIEVRLGLQRKSRLCVFHADFDAHLQDDSKDVIQQTEKQPTLFGQLDNWLTRTPFVNLGGYTFTSEYRAAVNTMFDDKIKTARAMLSGDALAAELDAIDRGKQKFEGIFDAKQHETSQKEGRWRMSWKALQAALFITVYRHEPVLQAPYNLLMRVMDVDELLARWRLRHALMVQRMVGMSAGTGGSSGYEYLMSTVTSHRIFSDLFALSTYIIPAASLPALPTDISNEMCYTYSAKA
jgi:tryptophan 2,3-dioxygenase